MDDIIINVAKDFSVTPGGRLRKEGQYSGEEFRKDILCPKLEEAIKNKKKILVNLDGCIGYPSSFLDESFGRLSEEYSPEDIIPYFKFISEDEPSLKEEIISYMKARGSKNV